jgi:hypothetical protein
MFKEELKKYIKKEEFIFALKEMQEKFDITPKFNLDTENKNLILEQLNQAAVMYIPKFDQLSLNTWKVLLAYTPIKPEYPIDRLLKALKIHKKHKTRRNIKPTIEKMMINTATGVTKEELLTMLIRRRPKKTKKTLERKINYYIQYWIPKQWEFEEKEGKYKIIRRKNAYIKSKDILG